MKKFFALRVFIITLLILVGGCATTKQDTSDNIKKLDELVAQKSFMIESGWALPTTTNSLVSLSNAGLFPPGSSAGMINLNGNPNYIKVKGDSISGYLPYFGERQMGGVYGGTNTGIEFEGIPKDYQVKKGKKNSYEITFKIGDKTKQSETYSVNIQLFSNLTSAINIYSSHRFSIRYRGNVSKIE